MSNDERIESELTDLRNQVAELRSELPQKRVRRRPPKPEPNPVAEFIKKHGGHSVAIQVGDQQLFPDGAVLVPSGGGFYQLDSPPDDAWKNNRARMKYATAKLERAEQDFGKLKSALQGGEIGTTFKWPEDEYGPPPPDRDERFGHPDGAAALKKLKAVVRERRQTVNAINKEPIACQHREVEEERKRLELERASADADRRRRISAINI